MLQLRRVTIITLVLVLLSTSTTASLAWNLGKSDDGVANGDIALMRDAQIYAARYAVDLQEAQRRLALQEAIGVLNGALERGEQATFAGLWIQHSPTYRVVAQFTRDGTQTIQSYVTGGPLANLVDVRPAALTLAELEAAQASALRAIRPLGVPVEAGLSMAKNRAEIYVVERARLDTALGAARLALPNGATVVTVPSLAQTAVDVYAGLVGNGCTLGFSVSGPEGTGTTTAAHCDNNQSTSGANLPHIFEWNGWDRDVQWHTAPGQAVKSLTQDGAGQRNVASARGRDNQSVGEVVCHYGITTGYGCGEISDKNRTGTGGYDSPTYIYVSNYGYNLSLEGDNGGPWYTGGTALGIMHATVPSGNGYRDAIYMAIDYIQTTGLNVLLNCPGGC